MILAYLAEQAALYEWPERLPVWLAGMVIVGLSGMGWMVLIHVYSVLTSWLPIF